MALDIVAEHHLLSQDAFYMSGKVGALSLPRRARAMARPGTPYGRPFPFEPSGQCRAGRGKRGYATGMNWL
jgi:hypothetical protein